MMAWLLGLVGVAMAGAPWPWMTPSAACGLGTPVEIYAFPDEVLPEGSSYLGLHVPGVEVDRIALALYLDRRERYRVLGHALAHAGYARSCAPNGVSETSEAFAQEAQRVALAAWEQPASTAARPVAPPAAAAPPSPRALVAASSVQLTFVPNVLVAVATPDTLAGDPAAGVLDARHGLRSPAFHLLWLHAGAPSARVHARLAREQAHHRRAMVIDEASPAGTRRERRR